MKKKIMLPDEYTVVIQDAADALRAGETASSLVCIREAMLLRMDAPEPHNLLGILCEMKGDDDTARRHYRAAYALDPTYKPACRNLERLVQFGWDITSRQYDYGADSGTNHGIGKPQQAVSALNGQSLGSD